MKHLVLLLTFTMAVVPAASQTPTQKPAFEVASIKVNGAALPLREPDAISLMVQSLLEERFQLKMPTDRERTC